MTAPSPAPPAEDSRALRSDVITTRHLVAFVISTAAPLTILVGLAPLAFLLGGAGVAALFIGGSYFTDKAAEAAKFNTFAPIILAGGIAVAAVALIHTFSAPKKN